MSNQALAKISNLQMSTMDDLRTIGEVFAKSGYFKDAADMSKAIVKIIAGAELGFGPVASMTGIYIVKERVTLSANLIGAAIKRSGRYTFKVLRVDNEGTAIEFFEGSLSLGVSTFTMVDAAKANLAGGDNWKKYPRNMCFARAMSNGAKWFCPDVFGGPVYTPDELGARIDGETGEIIEAAPATVHAFPQQQQVIEVEAPSPASTIAETTIEAIRSLAGRKGIDVDAQLRTWGKPTLEHLTAPEADKLTKWLDDRDYTGQAAAHVQRTPTQQKIRLFWDELKLNTQQGLKDFYGYLENRQLEFDHEIAEETGIPDMLGNTYANNLADRCAFKDDPLI